ncbi:MAG TPA: SDR family oxidoreductase [Anaerolineales bacterium]|nr:SDR family oxidoreductase [Anaerolineales bacterium]
MISFHKQVVLITGASRGIGRACAIEFSRLGARVAVHYHQNRSAALDTLAQLFGDGHFLVQANVALAQDVQSLIDETLHQAGRLDIVVNNAGVFIDHPIATVDFTQWQSAWQETCAINLLGAANVMFCAAQVMMQQGGGHIVNVSSRGAFRGEPDAPAYGASKAGLNAMSQSLAKALAPHHIFVHVVAPGFVDTEMAKSALAGENGDAIRSQSPLNRVAKAEEVAYAVCFAASEQANFMTGAIFDVNGASYLRS